MRVVKLKQVKRINGLHYAPDGRLLLIGGYEAGAADVGVWIDPAGGAELTRLHLAAECFAVAADVTKVALGNTVETGDVGRSVWVAWSDLASDGKLHTAYVTDEPGTLEIFGLAFDPTGKKLAVSFLREDVDGSGWDEFVVVPVGGRGKRIVSFEGNTACGLLAFSPDGKQIATSGGPERAPTVVVVDGKTLDYSHEFNPLDAPTRQLVYSPSGDELAVVIGHRVYLVSAKTGVLRLTLGGHPMQVYAGAFSPDGRRLLSACYDKQVRVWDVKSGQLLTSYDWKIGVVTALAFAPDGLTAAAGGEKGQIVVWDWE